MPLVQLKGFLDMSRKSGEGVPHAETGECLKIKGPGRLLRVGEGGHLSQGRHVLGFQTVKIHLLL